MEGGGNDRNFNWKILLIVKWSIKLHSCILNETLQELTQSTDNSGIGYVKRSQRSNMNF